MPKTKDPVLTGKICPYCGKPSELIDSVEIYGTSYGSMYICRDCNAYVGCHNGTDIALGRLANEELRRAKKKAHHYLDQLWKPDIHKRYSVYKWLSSALGIPRDLTHVGMSDIDQCNKITELSIERLRSKGINFTPWHEDE